MIPIQVAGFENQRIEVKPPGFVSGVKLFINDREAPKGKKRGEMVLRRDDETEVIAKWKGTFLDVPKLEVDGRVYEVVKPLKWYQWLWGGWPILLLFVGGAIGGLCGGLAFAINVKMYRAENIHPILQYLVIGLISVASIIAYIVLAIIVAQIL